MSTKVPVGIIGCGQISNIYCQNAANFTDLEVVACADLDPVRAEETKAKHHLPKALSMEEIFDDQEIQIILNLTIPAVHGELALRSLESGKSVYNEKPLAARRREARTICGMAKERGLRVGCAPDTFLGAGLQTCRKLIDSGAIGEPVAATAFMLSGGVESWHANPHFFYHKGGGPLFDMGPYYLTALTTLLGPVARVSAAARISFPERLITSQPLAGETIQVKTPTHHSANLEFANGVIGTLVTSFDVKGHHLPRMEIYGSEGTLSLPDPNTFGGPVLLLQAPEKEWKEMPLEFGYAGNSRGVGLADMASAIKTGRTHRCNEKIAFHVLEIMHSILDSAESGRREEIASKMTRPEPMPPGLAPGRVDL